MPPRIFSGRLCEGRVDPPHVNTVAPRNGRGTSDGSEGHKGWAATARVNGAFARNSRGFGSRQNPPLLRPARADPSALLHDRVCLQHGEGDVLKLASNRIAFSLEGGWRTGYGAGAILCMRPERPFVRCHAVCRPAERRLPEDVCELLSEKRKKPFDRISGPA